MTLEKHFLKPGRLYPGYRCPAGPGLRDIPAEGRWYEMTTYLVRRVTCGDARIADDEAPDDNLPAVAGGDAPAPVRVGPAGPAGRGDKRQ